MTERDKLNFARMAPIFEAHAVPEADRLFLYRAFDTLIEDDCCLHVTAAETIEKGFIGADAYDDLLRQHNRGHRRNRTWFTSVHCEEAYLTERGRALLRDLAAVTPDWQDRGGRAVTTLHYIRVRRARGLAMPLPPKPKARPLGPKVLCVWRDVPIRMRADVEKAGTWDEFIDAMAERDADILSGPGFMRAGDAHRAIAVLAFEHERVAAMTAFRKSLQRAMERNHERERRRPDPLSMAIELSKAIQAQRKPSIIARIFGRAA